MRRAVAGGAGGGEEGCSERGGQHPRHAARRHAQGGGRRPAHAVRSLRQGGEQVAPPLPSGAFVKEEGVVPPMPATVKREHAVVVKEQERSDRQAKRRRSK